MLVIRHVAGETKLHVYTSNLAGNAINTFNLDRIRTMTTSFPIVFGAKKMLDGTKYSYEDKAKGTIYWCKVWMSDLGDAACRDLACYIHEDITMQMCGFKRKYLSNVASQRSAMSFLASHTLYTKKGHQSKNVGGWASSPINTWLNTRFYNGLPVQIKQLIKQVKVISSVGNKSAEISTSNCYIYLPAVIELSDDFAYEPYISEETASDKTITFFDSSSKRIRYNANNVATEYWTRSPDVNSDSYFYRVKTDGTINQFVTPSTTNGLVIEFSI